MTRREGELLTFQRASYILPSLDSRWKIAVPRLGPAIIATRRPHLPGVAAAATAAAASHNPGFSSSSCPSCSRSPVLPRSRPPLGDPQSAVHDLVSHPRPQPLFLSILHAVIPRPPPPSPRREIPRILPLSFALDSANGINPPGGGSRRFSRVEPCRAEPS